MRKIPQSEGKVVVVTGGSGFIGSWIIIQLLQKGYTVRTTVRSLKRVGDVRAAITRQVDGEERLFFQAADLLKNEGWNEAIEGSDYLVHVASPMPVGEYKKTDVIRPAREGTRRILRAALNSGVRRVVITSSLTAAMPPPAYQGAPTDESVWTDLKPKHTNDYTKAKTLAEQDAWALMEKEGSTNRLTTILPGMVQGPVLGPDYSGSVELVTRMMTGKVPLLPRVGFSVIDVRDLADLHIRAMESNEAAGQRFIGTGDFLWLIEIAKILREHFGARAAKVATRLLPDFVVRLLAHANADLRFFAPSLGKRRDFSTRKAAAVLGWHARPAQDAILASAESLLRQGLS